jgi:hypothetical protein
MMDDTEVGQQTSDIGETQPLLVRPDGDAVGLGSGRRVTS